MATDAQIRLRKDRIIEWIVEGLPRHEVIKRIREEFGLASTSAYRSYAVALSEIALPDKEKERLRHVNMMRLERIYAESLKTANYTSAIRAIDLMNKTANLYEKEIKEPEKSDYNIVF